MTVFCPHPEMTVLGDSFFGNIQIGHDFDAGNQRLMHVSLESYILHNHAVNSHPNLGIPVKGLNMDIAGIALDGKAFVVMVLAIVFGS